MKGGAPTNVLRMSLKPATTFSLDLFQLIKGVEDSIGKRLIGEGPQPLRRLKFWRMGWQKEQMESFRNLKLGTCVPACPIHDQKNVLVWPHLLFLREGRQRERKSGDRDGGHEEPTGRATLWLYKAIEIHPAIARSHHRPNSAPFASPDATQDGFETDTVFVLTPQFNPGFWISLAQLLDLLRQFF